MQSSRKARDAKLFRFSHWYGSWGWHCANARYVRGSAPKRALPARDTRERGSNNGSDVIQADKYDALRDYLQARTETELVLSFEEIETILGFSLSRSSQRARWWEKERNPQDAMPQRNAIRDGGYEATRLPDGTGVRFRRIGLKRTWR